MPEGFEKADKNGKLSPTIGKPKLPGIPSISFGEAIDRIKKENESKNTAKSTMVNKMLSSIVSLLAATKNMFSFSKDKLRNLCTLLHVKHSKGI